MSKTWISSDLHLNHDRDFIYKERGFNSVGEMNKAIIERFNEVITPSDTLYLLGDIVMGSLDAATVLFRQLPRCDLRIIEGNHDTLNRWNMYGDMGAIRYPGCAHRFNKFGKWSFIFSHYPMIVSYNKDYRERRVVNVSGHTHNPDKFAMMNEGIYNIAVDAHNCYPVDIEQIIADIEAYH